MYNETGGLVNKPVRAAMKSREEEAMRAITQITLDLSAIVNLKHIKDLALNKKIPLNSPTGFLHEQLLVNTAILSLCKWLEFYKSYRNIIPETVIDHADKLNSDISKINPKSFRNAHIGHVLNKKTGKPLSGEEIAEAYKSIFGGNFKDFWKWLGEMNPNPNTVVSRMDVVRDAVRVLSPKNA